MKIYEVILKLILFAGIIIFYMAGYINCIEGHWTRAGLCAFSGALCTILFWSFWIRSRYMRMSLKKIDTLSGESFEQYLRAHFTKKGYQVKMTGASGDYGADLVLKKKGKITVVQAKRYVKPVGVAAVQEVIGARAYYEADKGMVVTNQTFTRNARNLADQSQIELWDRERIKKEFGAR